MGVLSLSPEIEPNVDDSQTAHYQCSSCFLSDGQLKYLSSTLLQWSGHNKLLLVLVVQKCV